MGQFFRIYFPASTLLNSLTFNTEQSISIISSYLFIGSSLSVSRHIGRAVSKLKVIRKGSPIILNVIQSFSAGPASTMFDSCGNQFRQITFFFANSFFSLVSFATFHSGCSRERAEGGADGAAGQQRRHGAPQTSQLWRRWHHHLGLARCPT